jgi:hypothetical protein
MIDNNLAGGSQMQKLTAANLLSLEDYAKQRADFRSKVIAHKKNRKVHLGDHATLYFEDSLTMQYQVQEMLRIERIFEEEGINDEVSAYNPLIPDGSNLKATFMVEYEDVEERKAALAKLIGIENKVWIQIAGFDKVYPVANEDLDRTTEVKTSSVHFLRFEFTPEMIVAAKQGADMAMGIEHDNYQVELNPVAENIRDSLVADFA